MNRPSQVKLHPEWRKFWRRTGIADPAELGALRATAASSPQPASRYTGSARGASKRRRCFVTAKATAKARLSWTRSPLQPVRPGHPSVSASKRDASPALHIGLRTIVWPGAAMRRRGVRTSLEFGPCHSAGWPSRMSRPRAAKGVGACLKRVLNTRLGSGAASYSRGGQTMMAACGGFDVPEPVRRTAT